MIGIHIALEFIRQALGGSRSAPPGKASIPGELYGRGMGRIPSAPVQHGTPGFVGNLPKAPFVPSRTFTPDTKVGTRSIIAPLKRN